MVRQTKRFKKGLNKKVLSAILAASMIMTSSSFAMAAPVEELTDEAPVAAAQSLEDVDTLDLENNDAANATVASSVNDLSADIIVPGQSPTLTTEGEGYRITGIQYTGEAIEPEFKLTDDDYVLKEGTDYLLSYEGNVVDSKEVSGEDAFVVVTFINDTYEDLGTVKVPYAIGQVPINNATVEYSSQDAFVYNGEEQYPEIASVVVKANDLTYTLSADDYEVVGTGGQDLVNAGSKKGFKIKGVGNFSGNVWGDPFVIEPAATEGNVTVEAEDTVFSTDDSAVISNIRKSVTVTDNFTGEEVNGSAYTILWYNAEDGTYKETNVPSTDIGVHTFRVQGNGTGNFSAEGYVEGTYEVVKDGTLQMAVDDMTNQKM